MVIYALARVGEALLWKVSHSTTSIRLNPTATGLSRELVGCLMWLANQTRPDNATKWERWLGTRNHRERYTGTAVGIFALTVIIWWNIFFGTDYIMSLEYKTFKTCGRQRFSISFPGSSLRNQYMVFSTSPVMRPSWTQSISFHPARRGHAHLLPLERSRIRLTI